MTTVNEMNDDPQRKRALSPNESFIVEAPAGSGKTGLLVQRFLLLLSGVRRPESVVAMTFTRKAAAEMKERVLKALEEAGQNTPLRNSYEERTRELALAALSNDKARSWRLLSDPSQLQIQTIDSLCAMLTRQMPLLSRFGGSPKVREHADELYRLAARRTLRVLSESGPDEQALFRRVSLHLDNRLDELERQIAAMLSRRDQWISRLHAATPGASEQINDFQTLLRVAHEQIREVFREHGEVDFTEITRAATEALGGPEQPTDLLYTLDYKIEHLLVDEFQDTSRSQYELLNALTGQWSDGDGHTLFLVGDPMQSIYGFRQAEVSLFLECCINQQLGSVRLNPLRLSMNFRSTPEIVNWIQSRFTGVMTQDDPCTGAVKLRPSIASREPGSSEPTMYAFIEDDGSSEAESIVKAIRAARKTKPKPASIAVLVRFRSHIAKLLPLLREKKIAYEAVEIDLLGQQQHILDLVSVTRAILHVADRVSWLACLRAPWCGLTLSDLAALAEGERERTIVDLLSDPLKIARLSPEGRFRALRVQEVLGEAVENAGRLPLRGIVESAWLAFGGPAVLAETHQRDDAETYFALLEQFEEGGIIRDFSLLNENLALMFAKPATEGERIQIMTIHGAKGLEFDVVILPKLHGVPPRDDKELLIWTSTQDELLIAAMPQSGEEDLEYKKVYDALKKKRQQEDHRLLYVAMTRARNELHLFGSAKLTKKRVLQNAGSNTHLGILWPHVKAQFEEKFRAHGRPVEQAHLDTPPATILRRLPAGWTAPILEPSIVWQPRVRHAAAAARNVTYEWVGDTGRHVGTVVHELLKRIAAGADNSWSPAFISSELRRLGVPDAQRDEATGRVFRAIERTLASERGQWILTQYPGARSEWPIAGRIGATLVNGTADRAFRDADGRFWIIDFKTSDHQGGHLGRFLDEEQRRYHAQLDRYATLVSRLEAGPISLGLYFPLLDAWREWEFEAEIPASASRYNPDAD